MRVCECGCHVDSWHNTASCGSVVMAKFEKGESEKAMYEGAYYLGYLGSGDTRTPRND